MIYNILQPEPEFLDHLLTLQIPLCGNRTLMDSNHGFDVVVANPPYLTRAQAPRALSWGQGGFRLREGYLTLNSKMQIMELSVLLQLLKLTSQPKPERRYSYTGFLATQPEPKYRGFYIAATLQLL